MIIRRLRLQRGWSQGQLAEMAGVTARTIQRIEQGQRPSLETSKALASVFKVDLSLIQPEESAMNIPGTVQENQLKPDEQEVMLHAKRIKEFYEFVFIYLVIAAPFLLVFKGEAVVYVVLFAIGVGLVLQGLIAFGVIGFLSPAWERRMVEKRLRRKL